MVDIEIDGKSLEVEPGSMIIEAADAAGIGIPRFCYHKKLSVAANCRMCLVEVEKVGKPLPACATPVTPGMKIFTRSAKALDAQRSVMEFLLINHPLDCPICDQGGECELQDLSLGYGKDVSRYTEGKRVVKDKDIGPLIATDLTRCIQCTRCVRFGTEIAGIRELGVVGRGDRMEIGTYIEHSLVSELSGNIIDLCPVGALTSKPYRFTARPWELQQYASIAAHDCVGSNVYAHTRGGQVMRVVPRENEAINETWISDRDRFSYLGLTSEERLTKPQIKIDGQWQTTDWETALKFAVAGLQTVVEKSGVEQLGAIASPSATLEELYLLQKLWRDMGSPHIDHRLQQSDFFDQEFAPAYPGMDIPLRDIEQRDAILLIGSNLQREQPLIAHRVRKASLQGAQVACINPCDYSFNFQLCNKQIVAPTDMVASLAGVLKALMANQAELALPQALVILLDDIVVNTEHLAMASLLQQAKLPMLLLGALALNHGQASTLRTLAYWISYLCQGQCALLTPGANGAGAWLAGAIPHRLAGGSAAPKQGLTTQAMLAANLKGYLLLGVEPELDCANSATAQQALAAADFVVVLSPFKSQAYGQYANVILPIAAVTETSGTFVNVEGCWQTFTAVATPFGEARPAWKVLRVLGNLLHLPGFDYTASDEVRHELQQIMMTKPSLSTQAAFIPATLTTHPSSGIQRLVEWPIYRSDSLVRRSKALQESATAEVARVAVNAELATKLGLSVGEQVLVKQDGQQVILPWVIDPQLPDNCALIPAGFAETAGLDATVGTLEIRPVI